MTAAFARSVEVMVPKLRQRLSKCSEALAAQNDLRQAAHTEVLPDGWCKALPLPADNAAPIYYRMGGSGVAAAVQLEPPPNTRSLPLAAYGATPEAAEAAGTTGLDGHSPPLAAGRCLVAARTCRVLSAPIAVRAACACADASTRRFCVRVCVCAGG